jgi:hypothetical protein
MDEDELSKISGETSLRFGQTMFSVVVYLSHGSLGSYLLWMGSESPLVYHGSGHGGDCCREIVG